MIRKILVAMGLMVAMNAQANTNTMETLVRDVNQSIAGQMRLQSPFDFKVGDTASYKLNMGGFINGTMVMTVKDVQPAQVTITQVVDMMGQKQNCEQVLNPNTGETISFKCDGKDQDQGDQSDIEVVETKEDTVTVPAGTFTCLYVKAKQKSSGDEIEQWVNPKEVPVYGMVKTTAPSQLGKVVIELTSFKKMP